MYHNLSHNLQSGAKLTQWPEQLIFGMFSYRNVVRNSKYIPVKTFPIARNIMHTNNPFDIAALARNKVTFS